MKPIQEYYNTVSKSTITRIINNENFPLVNLMFRSKPKFNCFFTHPPLDKAFNILPVTDRARLALKLNDIILNEPITSSAADD